MKIEVTQADIDAAHAALLLNQEFRSFKCPLAQALKRITGRSWTVNSHDCTCVADCWPILLPIRAGFAVQEFDNKGNIQPFDFDFPAIQTRTP